MLDGDLIPQKGGGAQHPLSPPILAYVLCPNGFMDQDATWYGGRPQPRPHCVTWRPSPPPIFGPCPNDCCDQMTGWIKMPLGTDADLGPGHIVLDGGPPPLLRKGAQQPPFFSAHVCCGQTVPISATAELLFTCFSFCTLRLSYILVVECSLRKIILDA